MMAFLGELSTHLVRVTFGCNFDASLLNANEVPMAF